MENNMQIENEIKEIIALYAKSVDALDLTLASQIWLDSSEVNFIHPRGHEKGFEEVKNNFYIGTMGNRFSERRLNVFDVSVQVYGDTAIAEFYWYFIARFKEDGTIKETKGRESQVYIKNEVSEWKLVHVHYSSMPVTGEREGF
jgi:ketosteroid isomerase-like protein